MGDFRSVDPPPAAVDALVQHTRVAARPRARRPALDLQRRSPRGTSASARGIPVFLRAISGHRDTGLTTCPGERLYAQLPTIARRVAALGLPKLYAPSVAPDESGGIRFTARLSSALPWSVVVTDAAGVELGRGEGTGSTVDWTWLPVRAGPGRDAVADRVARGDAR